MTRESFRLNVLAIWSIFIVIIFSFGSLLVWHINISSVNSPRFSIRESEILAYDSSHPLTEIKINEAIQAKKAREEAARKEAEIQQRISEVESFFSSYGAVISGYGEIIVRQAEACGGDYRILIGIAGNESGLGRVPYKLYNPFGYLNGVQYSGWEESLTTLSCEISKRFIAPCSGDLQCIINRYGGSETDKDKWIRNVSWFMSQV